YEVSSSDTYPANFGQGVTVGSSLAMSSAPVQAAVNAQSSPVSASIALDMSKGNTQQVKCTATVGPPPTLTLSTSNLKPGETMTLIFVQASGPTACTVSFPSNMHGGTTVSNLANSVMTQEFTVSNNGTDLYAKAAGSICTSSCGSP